MDVQTESAEFALPSVPKSPPSSTPQSPAMQKSGAVHAGHRRFGVFLADHSSSEENLGPRLQRIGEQFMRIRHQDGGDATSQISTPISQIDSPPASDASDTFHIEEAIDEDASEEEAMDSDPGSSDEEEEESEEGSSYARRTYEEEEIEFEIEEIDETTMMNTDEVDTIQPSTYEDADSYEELAKPTRWSTRQDDLEKETGIVTDLNRLCGGHEGFVDKEEIDRRHRKARNRWSAGLNKRTYSQSVGSESDGEDAEPLASPDTAGSARRLRRRVYGPGERASSTFEDTTHPVAEVDEGADSFPEDSPWMSPTSPQYFERMGASMSTYEIMEVDDNYEHQKFF